MKINKNILFFIMLIGLFPAFLSSCSETDDTVDEYVNWQKRNDSYYQHLTDSVKQLIANGRSDWRLYKSYSKNQATEGSATDYIIVHVLETGNNTISPIYSDSIRISYSGRLIPSKSFPLGYEFDKSYYGSYYPNTAVPAKMKVSDNIDGFITALQYMHVGDRWQVYIPYALAYGSTVQKSVPAYSTLVFDMSLMGIYKGVVPDWK